MNKKTIKIGTRGSKLALIQAEEVKNTLVCQFPDYNFELVVIKTKGDKILDVALSKIGDKGLFTKEIEDALLRNDIDIAVHSLKDLPTNFPDELTLGGVLKRGNVVDVLISKNGKKMNELPDNTIIATSSLRRKAQLLHYNKNFNVIDIRGNVETRIKKMEDGYCDALILASAGIIRLGMINKITEYLNPDIMLPAVCQGIIGIEVRKDDEYTSNIINKINYQETYIAAIAERTFLNTLEGGCQTPIGCITSFSNGLFTIIGFIADVNGEVLLKKILSGKAEDAEITAKHLAQLLLDFGGKDILKGKSN